MKITSSKTEKKLFHKIEYYKDNKLINEVNLGEVQDINTYWKNLKDAHLNYHNSFVELDNFVIVSKCVREYDYSVNKIIEIITVIE